MKKRSLSSIVYFAPEAEDSIQNFKSCLLSDSSLADFTNSFPADLVVGEVDRYLTLKLVGWMLTANFGPSAIRCFLDEFEDILVEYVVLQSQPIQFLDRPLDELHRKMDFFATFERVADSSGESLVRCLGGIDQVDSMVKRYVSDEAFQLGAIRAYCTALAHEIRKFSFKRSFGLINSLPIISQGCRSKSLVDLLPEQPREIASIFLDRTDAESAAHSFYRRWLNWLRSYIVRKGLSDCLPPHMNPAQSIEDARPHWQSALNQVVAELKQRFHQMLTSSQIRWLTSDKHWKDVRQRIQGAVRHMTAVNARGPLYAGENRAELVFLDGPAGEEDFDGNHFTLHEVFLETSVRPDHNIDPLTGQMIVLAIERDYDSFVDILGATGTDALRLKSLHEGDIDNNQIGEQIGKSDRTMRREGQKRGRLKQQVVSNVRKILKIG